MTKELVQAALDVGAMYPVFPTRNKKPAISNKELGLARGQGGFKIATQDRSKITKYFSHQNAEEISVPMGPMSGLLCIDPDLYKGDHVVAWWEDNKYWLEKTLCHKSKNGGLHYFFEWTDEVRFPATLAAGVDVKGNGGFVVFPPSGGYKILSNKKVQPFPVSVLKDAMIAKGGTGNNIVYLDGYNNQTDQELILSIQSAEEIYPALRSLAFRMPSRRQENGRYLSIEEMRTILERIMDTSVAKNKSHPRHEDWIDRREKITGLIETAVEKERGGDIGLSKIEIDAINQGEAFIETQKILASSARPIGPQRETTEQDVEKLVAAKTDFTDNSDNAKRSEKFARTNVSTLVTSKLDPIKWVVPQMLPEMATVSLAGMSNVGKTRWIAALVVSLSVGNTRRMGLPKISEKFSSVWIANEERTDDICRRLKAVALQHNDKKGADISIRGKGAGMLRLVAMNEAGTLEIDDKNIASLVAEIRHMKAKICIFDPYVTLSDAANENDAASAAMLTKAFLLITSMTGAAVIHAHHTPKERSKDNDWVRGDASAWRGSGAIYSALDCGFTLSNWMPRNKEQRIAWKKQFIDDKLSRFIVLDTGKIREGEALSPVIMELVPQQMEDGEGDPIGVCKVITEIDASNALLNTSIDQLGSSELALEMISRLGEGTHKNMSDAHRIMKDFIGWPDTTKREGKEKLQRMFGDTYTTEKGTVTVHLSDGRGRAANWNIVIVET